MCRSVTGNFVRCEPGGNFLENAKICVEKHPAIRCFLLSCFTTEPKGVETGMESQDKWLTIEELSGYLKMSRSKLYQMAQKGELPGSKIGTQWRFDRDRIDAWMNEKMSASSNRKTGVQHA